MKNFSSKYMLILKDINRMKSLSTKKSKRDRLNSAIFHKNNKNVLKHIDNNSYVNSQPFNNYNNNLYEETKSNSNSNYNNSLFIPEKERNILKQNPKILIKVNNLNGKTKTEKGILSINQSEINNRPKNKCIFLTYKENCNINQKKNSFNSINISKFIYEINSFLLPNDQTFDNLKNLINYRIINKESSKDANYYKLLKREDIQNRVVTYELFYKYIIKRTFKELLKKGYSNNTLITKKEVKDEYQRQINDIKQYLKLQNKKNKDKLYKKYSESFEKKYIFPFTTNLYEQKISSIKNYQIINIERHKRFKKINPNNSVDNINFHFYNFDKVTSELNNQNLNCKNKELTKRKFRIFLSLSDITKIIEDNQEKTPYTKMPQNSEEHQLNSEMNIKKVKDIKEIKKEKILSNNNINNNNKDEIFKTRVFYPKEKKLKDIIKIKKKNIFNNNENFKQIKIKGESQFQKEKSNNEKINGFKLFLDKQNTINNKNEDIINFLYNKEKKIKFNNIIINNNINQYFFNHKIDKIDNNNSNNNKNNSNNKEIEENTKSYKKEVEVNLSTDNINLNIEIDNNSFNLEKEEFNKKDLKLNLQTPPKYTSSFLQKSSSQNSLFEEKFTIDKSFFKFNNNLINLQEKKKETIQNYSQLFHKDIKPINKEKENEKMKFLWDKKVFIKKKKATKERSFKDFIKDEMYDQKIKSINNKVEVKKIMEYTDKKDIKIKTRKDIEEENERLIEKNWEFKFNNFKNYIQKLKNMSKAEFIDDTLKFIKYYE